VFWRAILVGLLLAALAGWRDWRVLRERQRAVLEIEVAGQAEDDSRLRCDLGHGFGAPIRPRLSTGADERRVLRFSLPDGAITALRWEAVAAATSLRLQRAEILGNGGASMKRFRPSEVVCVQDISKVEHQVQPALVDLVFPPNAEAPQVSFALPKAILIDGEAWMLSQWRTTLPWSMGWTFALGCALAGSVLCCANSDRLRCRHLGLRVIALSLALLPVAAFTPIAHTLTTLDGSWKHVLSYATEHELGFGRDLLYTYGPTGTLFLSMRFFLGSFATTLSLWLWSAAALATLLACLLARLSWPLLVPWLATFSLLPMLLPDPAMLVFLWGCSLIWLDRPRGSRVSCWVGALDILWAGLLGILLLAKFSVAVPTAGVLGAVALHTLLVSRRWGDLLRIHGTASLSTLLSLAFTGHSLLDIAPFINGSLAISDGYQEAMATLDPDWVVQWGLLAVAAFLLLAVALARSARPLINRCMLVLIWLGLGAFAWKTGFVRAAHVGFAFEYFSWTALFVVVSVDMTARRKALVASVAGILLFVGLQTQPYWLNTPKYKSLAASAMDGATFLPWSAQMLQAERISQAWGQVGKHLDEMAHPTKLRNRLEQAFAAAKTEANIPELASRIGSASVDVYNYNQGYAIATGLDYRPRPVFQGYVAYTPELLALNLAHHEVAPPEYLLFVPQTIDNRYPMLDEGALVLRWLREYAWVGNESPFFLLQRLPEGHAHHTPPLVLATHEGHTELGTWVTIPSESMSNLLFLRSEQKLTAHGRLMKLLYKPASLRLEVLLDDGSTRLHRLNSGQAAGGCILSPYLPDQVALAAFLSGEPCRSVSAFRVTVPEDGQTHWDPEYDWQLTAYAQDGFRTLPPPALATSGQYGVRPSPESPAAASPSRRDG